MLLVLLLLAGCGSGGSQVKEDRQFASNAKTAPPETIAPTFLPTESSSSGSRAGGPGEAVSNPLSTRGAPARAFLLDGSTVTLVDLSRNTPVLTEIPVAIQPGDVIRDIAESPSGDRVAVLTSDALSSRASLRVALYSSDGRMIVAPSAVSAPAATPEASPRGEATPVATPATPSAMAGDGTGERLVSVPSSLSWAPTGDRLVVTVAGSSIAILAIDSRGIAVAETIDVPMSSGTVAGAWLSPRGDSLLVLVGATDGNRAIALVSLSGADRRPHVVWPGTDERRSKSVRQAAWLPDGTGIVFTSTQTAASVPGTLSTIDLDTLTPRVLATSGRAGPSARVGSFAISPDGKSVAYALETPTDNGWSFHSLWARSIRGGSSREISTANGDVTGTPIWTSQGVLWTQSNPAGTEKSLIVARSDGESAVIATWSGERWITAPVSATPIASPKGSPMATPATPVAAPATPASSPAS